MIDPQPWFSPRVSAALLTAGFLLNAISPGTSISGAPGPDHQQRPPNSTLGKSIYEAKCSQCHGLSGKGDGPAASILNPSPRDFTSGKFKFRSTESGSIPTDGDLATSIRNGLHGTSMSDWEPFLRGDTLNAVVEYVKLFSPRFAHEQPKPVAVGKTIPSSPQSIASGKAVYEKLQCAMCHGPGGNGTGAVAVELRDDIGNETMATNLTEPWTFRGGATSREIYLRFRTGIDGTPMPSFVGSATDKEMWNLANYVVSLARKPVWNMNDTDVARFYKTLDGESKQNPAARGKYLVQTLGCGDCHTPVRSDGSSIDVLYLAGGQRWHLGPYGYFVAPNLTSDKETGLGNWTDEQIETAMTKGLRNDGSRMLPFPMPWPDYAQLKQDDLKAIVSYLRTVPAVSNKIPAPQPLNIISYLWAKFKMLILKEPLVGGIESGNAGSADITKKEVLQ